MTYIDYLNQFNRWLEDDNPTDKVIVLYYAMLNLFNRRGWPRWAGVDTQHLMVLARTTNKNTAFRARDALVNAGFVEYRPGKKGKATFYQLLELDVKSSRGRKTGFSAECGNTFDTENGTENGFGIKSDTENGTKNGTENVPLNKNKNKIKTVATGQPDADEADSDKTPEDPELGRAMTELLNFIPQLSPLRIDTFRAWYESLGADVCIMAVYEARDANINGRAAWSYIESILERCERSNIRSQAAWEADQAARRQKRQKNAHGVPDQRSRVQIPEEYDAGDMEFHL